MRTVILRISAYLRRVALARPLLQLLWKVGPRWLLGLGTLTVLMGLLPLASMVVGSALLNVIAAMLVASHASKTLPIGLIALLALEGALNLIGRVLSQLRIALGSLYQKRMSNYTSEAIARTASSLDFPYFENPEFFNRLSNAMAEASYRPAQVVNQATQLGSSAVTLVSVTVVLLFWHAWILPIVALFSLTRYIVGARFSKQRVDLILGRTPLSRMAQYIGMLLTGDYAAKEVRLFNLRDYLLQRYQTLLDAMYRQDSALAKRQLLAMSFVELFASLGSPLLVAYVALQTVQQLINLGQFNLYAQAIAQVDSGLAAVMALLAQLYENKLFIDNLLNFLHMEPRIEAPRPLSAARQAHISATPLIEFRDVSFTYPDAREPAIEHLTMAIKPGEVLALVGENGAGKTTMVKLLAGLYLPTSGRILFDGVDTAELDRAVLRDYLGIILQDFITYHFSAADNIGIGCVDQIANRERIEAAARQSGFDRVVRGMPFGFNTILGRFIDRGHELSGGQRQLVGLARALMRNAPILVLDEPTSALDTRNELHVFRQLLESRKSRQQTIIFISHRFSTVRRADRIIVFGQGAVLEQGSHDELMEFASHYREMFTTQVRMYGEDALEQLDAAFTSENIIEQHI